MAGTLPASARPIKRSRCRPQDCQRGAQHRLRSADHRRHTHIFRLGNPDRTGSGQETWTRCRAKLARVTPRNSEDAHRWLILRGRYVYQAQTGMCHCIVADLCSFQGRRCEGGDLPDAGVRPALELAEEAVDNATRQGRVGRPARSSSSATTSPDSRNRRSSQQHGRPVACPLPVAQPTACSRRAAGNWINRPLPLVVASPNDSAVPEAPISRSRRIRLPFDWQADKARAGFLDSTAPAWIHAG